MDFSTDVGVRSEYSSHVPKIKKGKSTLAGSFGNRDLAKFVNLSASASNSEVLLKAVPYEEFFPLNDQVKVCFHDAGHILGSAMIEVVFQDKNGPQNIIFSGDIGQWDKPLLNNPSVFDRADYVVMESTYGDRDHDNPQDIDDKLSQVINDAVKAGGNVIIPTFAIERAQELLYYFSSLARAKRIPYIVTFLDSPMAVEVTKVFEQSKKYFDKETLELFKNGQSPFDFPGLKLVESIEGVQSN